MKTFQWAVVGAGPAGIAAVGKLLDNCIPATDILWIDPYFKVGDLGMLWSNLSSNTKVCNFINFLTAVDSFSYKQGTKNFKLNHLDPNKTCLLKEVVEPLQWISDQFIHQVVTERLMIHNICLANKVWSLGSDSQTFKAKNVILATGSVPLNLDYPGIDLIPLEVAIDKKKLASVMNRDETYAVFGSSHSAMMILHNLVELKLKKIVNFYRSPCKYAIDLGSWILFDNTGLKGETAAWAKENIDGKLPDNLVRYMIHESHIARYLPECDKVIYAVGFEKRKNIVIGDFPEIPHNPYVGILAPGLFGFGIAYPELKTDPFGYEEHQVGLWKFIQYLNRVMPVWMKYST